MVQLWLHTTAAPIIGFNYNICVRLNSMIRCSYNMVSQLYYNFVQIKNNNNNCLKGK